MTASAGPALTQLHREFGDRVAFVTLYVREAHPGERYPQPDTLEKKLEHARAYRERDQIPWPVAVDGVEGDLHRALDAKPNAAYLMDTAGTVAFRALWSNDPRALRKGLGAIVSGRPSPIGERQAKVVPMVRAMGVVYEVLGSAGEGARQDLRREAPPMYAMARLAALFRPLPPLGRGVAAVATGALGALLAIGGLSRLARRRR